MIFSDALRSRRCDRFDGNPYATFTQGHSGHRESWMDRQSRFHSNVGPGQWDSTDVQNFSWRLGKGLAPRYEEGNGDLRPLEKTAVDPEAKKIKQSEKSCTE